MPRNKSPANVLWRKDLRAEVLLIASPGLFLLLLWWGRRRDLLESMLGDETAEQRMSQVWALVKRTACNWGETHLFVPNPLPMEKI